MKAIIDFTFGSAQRLWRERVGPELVDGLKSAARALECDHGANQAYIKVIERAHSNAPLLKVPDPTQDPDGYASVLGTRSHEVQLAAIQEAAECARHDYTRLILQGAIELLRNHPGVFVTAVECVLETRKKAHANPPICMNSVTEAPPDVRGWVPPAVAEA